MPSSSKDGSPMTFASFRRPILTIGSYPVHSEINHDSNTQNLDTFQRKVFTCFHEISVVDANELLSISWICKLLDAFSSCLDHFQAMLTNNRGHLLMPPADRLATEFFDRAIKALDISNATRDGIERIRMWQKHLEIVLCALDTRQRILGEAQFRRARKALIDLALVMIAEKDTDSTFSHRNNLLDVSERIVIITAHRGHSRSLSWRLGTYLIIGQPQNNSS